jgi:hypothetical protein
MITGCQWIGPEQTAAPYTMCGCKVFPGKSYCEDHVWRVYKKNTNTGNKRKIKEIENELAELKRLEEIADLIGETDV